MAQHQPRRSEKPQPQPIKYGDVFLVSEEIAEKPIAPQDAAAMQSAESQVLGHPQRGGPASVMQSAAMYNVEAGIVPRGSASDVGENYGMTVTETTTDGRRIITQSIGEQVVARYGDSSQNATLERAPSSMDPDAVTIGEALESSAISAVDKPINQSDAAAIQAAEMLALGSNEIPPDGLGAEAQSAATRNSRLMSDDQKITIGDVLMDASSKLGSDKPVNVQDAEKVLASEMRNNPKMATNMGGVADSLAAAARLNQRKY